MAEASEPSPATEAPYVRYAALMQVARRLGVGSLHGRLLLAWSADADLAAARVAGAATLLLADETRARAAVRSGAADFAVTSLDEALRILKNEVRRAAPVGVCLVGDVAAVLAECVARGVQPDVVDGASAELSERGAHTLDWKQRGEETFASWWLPQGSLRLLSEMDALARESLEEADALRLRWLEQAPAAYGRAMHRWRVLPMRASERRQLLQNLDDAKEHWASFEVRVNGAPAWPERLVAGS